MSKGSLADRKQADAFRMLFEGFGKAYADATMKEAAESEQNQQMFKTFFPGYNEALERWRKQQEERADDFNLLEVMQVTGKEIVHSRILAWFLDWDMTSLGTHAQGNLGFRLFLQEFGLPITYAEGRYRVKREVSADESRIDVEIAERQKFVIHIENKIWSLESDDQTNKEWKALQKRSESLGCTDDQSHAFYLTPDGRKPCSPDFQPISWLRIAKVFEKFDEAAKPEDARLFARHYAKVLKTHIIRDLDEKENDDASEHVQ